MDPIGLYIHIPFCASKCGYCDFYSETSQEGKEAYVQGLLEEIRSYRAEGVSADTLFIGGGTPSVMEAGQLVRLLNACREAFGLSGECTLEANPDSVSPAFLKEVRAGGFNRISFGAQSTVNEELRALGRRHDADRIGTAVRWAREAGFENLSLDVMLGIPGQDTKSLAFTLDAFGALQPEHLSCYLLKIEEGTPFYRQHAERLCAGDDEAADLYLQAVETLEKMGYGQYEISNFAKPGYECKHNMVYWTGGEYIGFGIGASSYFQGKRFNNMRDIFKYIELMENLSDKFVETDNMELLYNDTTRTLRENVTNIYIDARMEEFMFLGLRMTCGVSREDFKERFNKDIYEVYGSVLNKYIGEGFMASEGDRIYLTDAGIDVSNVILADFLLDS